MRSLKIICTFFIIALLVVEEADLFCAEAGAGAGMGAEAAPVLAISPEKIEKEPIH